MGPPWFEELTAAWFRHLRRRGRSPNTVKTYGSLIADLGRWLETQPEITQPELLKAHHLHAWQDDYLERHPHESTQANAATAARSFLKWAAREELGIEPGLWDRVDQVQVPEIAPLVLEPETIDTVLSHYQRLRKRDLIGHRDRALFAFLLTTGARISEALQLDVVDVDRTRWVVRQKGGRQKRLVASQRAREWLTQYLAIRGDDDVSQLWVWVRRDGSRRALGPRDANRIWAQLARQLNLSHFTSRFMRGTSATELKEHGATDTDTAEHLGHRGTATIHRYSKLREGRHQQLVNALDDLIPSPPPEALPRRRGGKRPLRIVQKRKR